MLELLAMSDLELSEITRGLSRQADSNVQAEQLHTKHLESKSP